jgi:hypothetical protein
MRVLRVAGPVALLVVLACGKASKSSSSSAGSGGTGAHTTSSVSSGSGGKGGGTADGGADGAAPATGTCAALATLPARTPTYFVDFVGGSDAHDGKTQGTAWQHAPGDANATGSAMAATLVPGDVVLLKGGVEYDGTIALATSGTAAAPIVLEGGAQQGWGTGNAIVDGQNTRALGVSVSSASYVVVEGFEVRNFDKTQGSTGIQVSGGDHDTVVGNVLHDIYYATNPGGTSWEQQRGTGISVTNSSATNVYANSVRDCGNAGISISADAGGVVTGGAVSCNEITNMNWGIVVALGDSVAGTHVGGLTIAHNYIHDFDNYYVCNAWHRDGIFAFGRPDDGTLSVDSLEIADNYFEDNTSALGSTAWIYLEFVCTNFNIHHNLLNQSRSYYGIRILGDGFQVAGNHTIASNVIANSNGQGSAGMHIMQSSGARIVNNVFYDDDVGYMIAADSMMGATGDYDLFFRTSAGTNVAILDAGPAESPAGGGAMSLDLAGMQAQGFEQHGLYGDPLWAAPFATIHGDATAFKPMHASPAVDHGATLTYAVDYAGAAIPEGAGPDIGTFEQ